MNDGGRIWQDIDQAYRGNPPGEVLAHGWLTDAEVLRLLLTDPCPRNCGLRATRCRTCGGRGWTAKPELVERIAKELDCWFDDTDTPPVAAAVLFSMLEEQ